MSIKLNQESAIEIDENDLAALLTDTFCDSFTPFANLFVENVRLLDDGRTFSLTLSVKETEAA